MPRVFSKSASTGQVQEHASASQSPASTESVSLPVPAASVKPVVCSGTARELRRLKRKDRLATDSLPESSAATASALAVTMTKIDRHWRWERRCWQAIASSVYIADFSGVEGDQGLGDPLLVNSSLVDEQVHGGRLVGIEAPQPANALGSLRLVAEGVPDDAHPQIHKADTLRELGYAHQALDGARAKQGQVNFAVLVLAVIGMGSLLLVAGKEQDLVRLLVGQVAHVVAFVRVVHQGLHAQNAQRLAGGELAARFKSDLLIPHRA
nr:hypothetical protein [Tanacetum cinerariifolium]